MDEEDFDFDDEEEDDEREWIEPDFSRRIFKKWRSPRFGKSNPEVMTNPVWSWLVRTRLDAYHANQHFKGPDPFKKGPCWCCQRFGQSKTTLKDGREVLIGGEHEDFYDPDFQIYNDVIVRTPGDEIEIFGYPSEIFPPTDFHSATLTTDGRIIVIGNLGYPEERRPGETPVFVLDTNRWSFLKQETTGNKPGWIHRHSAALAADERSITLSSGTVVQDDEEGTLLENIDDWRLDLDTWTWERLTEKPWQQWEFFREDDEGSNLFFMRHAMEMAELDIRLPKIEGMDEEELGDDLDSMFRPPDDPELFKSLYQPPCDFEAVPEEDPEEYNVFRIAIDGVILRFVEDGHGIQMMVEGELPPAIVATVVEDIKEKLSKIEKASFAVKRHR